MVIDLPNAPHMAAHATPLPGLGFDARLDGLMGLGGLSVAAKLGELERLARLMQTQGLGVEATRMLFDMGYANEVLATALTLDCAPLQELAERLQSQYRLAGHFLGLSA